MPMERNLVGFNSEVGDMDGDKNRGRGIKDNGIFENLRASESKRDAKDDNDRRTAASNGRHSGRRLTSERGWWKDSRVAEQASHKAPAVSDEEGEFRVSGGLGHQWQHDRFSEAMADAHPPTKKQRPFRDEKPSSESENVEKSVFHEPKKVSHLGSSTLRSGRWEERVCDRCPREKHEQDRAYARERSYSNGGRIENTGFLARDRFNGIDNYGKFKGRYNNGGTQGYLSKGAWADNNGKFKGRYNNGGTQGYWSNGAWAEKWKHDLFDEANRSPSPKKEEDPGAKVEALLSM